jgi:hypothetical protein
MTQLTNLNLGMNDDLTAVSPQIKAQILAEALPTSAITTARPSSSNTAAMP